MTAPTTPGTGERDPFIRIDLRTELAQPDADWGPLDKILWTASQLGNGQILELVAPFEPLLLIRVLTAQGFSHEARRNPDGDWEVFFWQEQAPPSDEPPAAPAVIELDLRGVQNIPSLSNLVAALLEANGTTELVVLSDRPLDTGALPENCACLSIRSSEMKEGTFRVHLHIHDE